jgi:hypothetical protein
MDKPAVYAEKGTKILDDDGKLVATLARDVLFGEVIQADQFVMSDGKPPEDRAPIPYEVARFAGLVD